MSIEYKVQFFALNDDTTPVVEGVTTEAEWPLVEYAAEDDPDGVGAEEAEDDEEYPLVCAIDYVLTTHWRRLRPRHRRSRKWEVVVNGTRFDVQVEMDPDGELCGTTMGSKSDES